MLKRSSLSGHSISDEEKSFFIVELTPVVKVSKHFFIHEGQNGKIS
jgi:hypothetical protein